MSALLVAVVGLGGFWAGRATVGTGVVESDLPSSGLTAQVEQASLGRVLMLNVTAEQPKVALAVNGLTGVVTQAQKDLRARQGSVLYRVAGIPVRAVEGRVPFYRDLAAGDVGADVAQLRGALVALGYLSTPGDDFDTATFYALREWQRSLGMPLTGRVRLGELVAAPTLPARLLVDSTVAAPGKVLAGGESVVSGSRGVPRFSLVVSEDQARLMPQSASVSMKYAGQKWSARIVRSRTSDAGDVVLTLAAPNGGPVCRQRCQALPAGNATSILSEVTVVPKTEGPAIPVAAISTAADGSTSVQVVGNNGQREETPVTVRASQDGMAVVEGLDVGETVQVFADAGQPNPAPTNEASP